MPPGDGKTWQFAMPSGWLMCEPSERLICKGPMRQNSSSAFIATISAIWRSVSCVTA